MQTETSISGYLYLLEEVEKYFHQNPGKKSLIQISWTIEKLKMQMPSKSYIAKCEKPKVTSWFNELELMLAQDEIEPDEFRKIISQGRKILAAYLACQL